MSDADQTRRVVEEGKLLLAREQAKRLVEEGKAQLVTDLRGGLAKLRQAFAIAPDYPDLEDEIFLREDAIDKLDSLLDYIVVLLKEHKDYQACQLLKDLPSNYIIQDRTELLGDLTSRISRAESLIEESRQLPKSGGSPSLKIIEEAYGLVPDYPGLQEEVAAVRGSVSRHQVYLDSIEESIRAQNFPKASELLKVFQEVYPNDAAIRKFEVAIRNKQKAARTRQQLQKTLRTSAKVAVVLAVLGGGYFGYETWLTISASGKWDNLTRQLDAKKYPDVQATGREILVILNKVRIFGGGKKAELLDKVNQVLQSETVKQGAIGKVMVDGAFVPTGDVDKVNAIKQLRKEGGDLVAAGKFSDAIPKFEEAQKIATDWGGDPAVKYVEEIKTALRAAQEGAVNQIIEESRVLKGSGDFDGAVAKLNAATELAARYGLASEATAPVAEGAYQEIEQGRFREMAEAGDRQLATGRFAEAIASYEQALAFAQAKNMGSSPQLGKIKGSMVLAKVNILAGKGDDLSNRARWADAIASYAAALKLHEESGLKKDLPVFRRTTESLAKARRVAALEEIRSSEREAQKYVAAEEWPKARKAYEREIIAVDQGAFAADPDFVALRQNAAARMGEVDEKLFLAEKRDYLLERHRSILKQAFGLGSEVALLDPAAVLLGSAGDTLKYSLSARSFAGKGGGGVYTVYEVTYAFNRKSGAWLMLDKKTGSKSSGGR